MWEYLGQATWNLQSPFLGTEGPSTLIIRVSLPIHSNPIKREQMAELCPHNYWNTGAFVMIDQKCMTGLTLLQTGLNNLKVFCLACWNLLCCLELWFVSCFTLLRKKDENPPIAAWDYNLLYVYIMQTYVFFLFLSFLFVLLKTQKKVDRTCKVLYFSLHPFPILHTRTVLAGKQKVESYQTALKVGCTGSSPGYWLMSLYWLTLYGLVNPVAAHS